MARTKAQLAEARKRFKLPRGPWNEIDLSARPHPADMTRCYTNNRFVVMVYDDDTFPLWPVRAIRVMVQRHDDKPIPNHWRELQRIKNEIFGHEIWAVECYPAEPELIDDANIYWLWIPFFDWRGLEVAQQ